ncbi:serine/arginine-rich splicing factor 7-like isoform X11 [Mytilus californianus]|uniref:serine/arginine-rich splicing factor 7-like isoform X10 n=1 Tax=Mytilus californianus TaxID=6549 RepID=UPI002246BB63|nr:serine/arginine-rich splicing factor 7-like isoform X10 [Mytilus californianus]XP_052064663.1 serine/arginine-rich splicing factor 7-like isoform X11 [Mytilus californianus]
MSRYSSRDSDRDRGRGGGGGGDPDTKLYVGDLARDAHERDLERAFSYYGRLRNVWVARNPAGFAFVEFEDPRDADDAVRALDGTNLCGSRIRVEHSTGKVRPKPWLRGGRGPPGGGRDGGDRGGGGGGGRGGERSGGGGSRDGGAGGRKPFDPADRCYECGDRGHYAYDCSRYRGKDRARKSSSYSKRSRSRSYSRSRSRSHSRGKARSYSRSRSRSPVARSTTRSPSPY